MNKKEYLLPRLIRLRDILHYLGVDRRIFNKEVRPFLTEIPIGAQGKAFDRLDLINGSITIRPVVGVPLTLRG